MSNNKALIEEIEANLQTIRNSRANGQLPSDERVQLLSRAVTALYQSERDRTQAITDAITAEDQANNLAGDVAQMERELTDQATVIRYALLVLRDPLLNNAMVKRAIAILSSTPTTDTGTEGTR